MLTIGLANLKLYNLQANLAAHLWFSLLLTYILFDMATCHLAWPLASNIAWKLICNLLDLLTWLTFVRRPSGVETRITKLVKILLEQKCSLIGALKCNFPPFSKETDRRRRTNKETDIRIHRKVTRTTMQVSSLNVRIQQKYAKRKHFLEVQLPRTSCW